MSWKELPLGQQPRDPQPRLRIHRITRSVGSNSLKAALNAAADRFLRQTIGVEKDKSYRVVVLRDEQDPTRLALRAGDRGLSVTRGGEFAGGVLHDVIGNHMPAAGLSLPLEANGELLIFRWPPEDLQAVTGSQLRRKRYAEGDTRGKPKS